MIREHDGREMDDRHEAILDGNGEVAEFQRRRGWKHGFDDAPHRGAGERQTNGRDQEDEVKHEKDGDRNAESPGP